MVFHWSKNCGKSVEERSAEWKKRSAEPKVAAYQENVKKDLLPYSKKDLLQLQEFGEEQKHEFEAVRKFFEEDVGIRSHLGLKFCEALIRQANPNTTRRQDIGECADFPYYKPEKMDEQTAKELKAALRDPPRFLYRASSWQGKRHTNGHDELTIHLPAAHKNRDERCADTIYDEPNGLGELAEMLGRRYLWQDRRKDATLSWTSSLLFALVLALGRKAKDQEFVVIHVIDTTKVTTLDGRPVEFHYTRDIMRILKVTEWPGWNDQWERLFLRQPWYTHEYVTHGAIESPVEHSLELDLDEALDAGLMDLIPSLLIADPDEAKSLYQRCVYTRGVGHGLNGQRHPLTTSKLELANKIGCLFLSREARASADDPTAPIFIFVDLLGMYSRPRQDETFMEWMKARYTPHDMNHVEYHRSTRIANNLPEQAESLQLARDACGALQATAIPPTTVWVADPDFDWNCKWLRGSYKRIKAAKYRSKGNGCVLNKLNGPGLPPKQTGNQNDGGKDDHEAQSKATEEAPSDSGRQSHARNDEESQDEPDAKRRKTSAAMVQGSESNVDLDIDEVEESDLEISDDEEDDELELGDDDDD